ncbi:calcium-binding protein [Roseomonas sp. KE2513]|uniref:glycoside hydrolase family 113 n=1 Tax=Roseomonas sp. KE2513 TaxID=2479202 RepID=UPI001E61B676|nr:carbohydrate-binding domain-containing protein [Roseomonas sp. KE2513]MBI0534830.1 calcium-binding protein [Roseomonas sp. KE2513]
MNDKLFTFAGFGFPSWWNGNYGSAEALASLTSLKATGANSVSITPTSFISTVSSSDFRATSGTESDANVRAEILQAQSLGLDVILKPHVDALDGADFRGEFSPSDVGAWFAGYKALILRYAAMAAETGVKTLCIGCEYDSLSGAAYRQAWVDIIDSVRAIYSGTITYAATSTAAKDVSFWDKVDLIGVNAYYSMSSSATATVEDYKAAWTRVPERAWEAQSTEGKSPIDFLHDLSLRYGKPLFITEVGYRSLDGAAIEPALWNTAGPVDLQEQANLYQALFQIVTTYGGDWFAGLHLWNWDVVPDQGLNTGFSPQGKPALDVVTQWFTGNGIVQGLSTLGTDTGDILDGGLGNDLLAGERGNDLLRGSEGNDFLVGGPDSLPEVPRATSTIVVSAYGGVFYGVGAQFVVLVNGHQVGPVLEARATGSDFAVTFANSEPVTSVAISFLNDLYDPANGIDRSLYIQSILVNGHSLPISESRNPSGDGTGALWFNSSMIIDTSSRQDWFTGSLTDHDTLIGGAGDDTLLGGGGEDMLLGGDGADLVYAGAGHDILFGDAGNDVMTGDGGRDTLLGGEGDDLLFGGSDNDVLYGQSGADHLRGDAGDDVMTGDAGNDILVGGDGNDLAFGGEGGDTLYGEDGADHLRGDAGDDVMTGDAGNDTLVGGGGNDLAFGGEGGDTLYGEDGADHLRGDAGDDVMTGDAGNDTLVGGGGNDLAFGGDGGDILYGEDGADHLRGDAGDDTLVGGAGNDTLVGGAGADTFVFNPGHGQDWVADFTAGVDRLLLQGSGYSTFAQLVTSGAVVIASDNHATISTGSGTIILDGAGLSALSANDFIFG